MHKIQELRDTQKKLRPQDWKEIYKLTDEALHGVLHYYQSKVVKNYGLPLLNFTIPNTHPEVLVDIAWPHKKVALLVKTTPSQLRAAKKIGWTVRDLNSASQRMLAE